MPELSGIKLPDYLLIATFFVIIVCVGVYFSRYVRKVKDYFVAGSSMPWWLAGTSFYMASFTCLMFVVYNEVAYLYGIVAVTYVWILNLCMVLSGFFLAHRWRRARILTPLAFMERRYDKKVHQLFIWMGIPYRLLDNGLRIFTTALVLTVAIHHPALRFEYLVLIVGCIMIAYTYLGGQLAVIITDFVQAIIILVAVIMLAVLIFLRIDNFPAAIASMPQGFFLPVGKPYDLAYLLFACFAIGIFDYGANWSLVQKYNTTRSDRDARKMVWYLAVVGFIMPPLFFFPGLAARYLLPNLENTRYVYAVICLTTLPVGVMGFMIAALLSATMSTLGSEFNTMSAILTRDFYKKKFNPDISDQREVFLGRIFTIVIGLVIMSIAFLLNSIKTLNLMDIMVRYFAAFGPPLAIPIVTGLLFKHINSRGVTWGVIGGVLIGVTLQVANVIVVQHYGSLMATDASIDYWLRSGWTSFATLTTIVVVFFLMWLGTRVKKTGPEELERVDRFFEDLKKPYDLDLEHKGFLFPFNVMSVILAVLGAALIVISVVVALGFHDIRAFRIDLIVGVILGTIALSMRVWLSKYSL
jgi:solute:Na+ symporter, SSS family